MTTVHTLRIKAQVNPRLLAKASRLFTGTLAGRIIEILQNARRAGARHVHIANHRGRVTVRDDGRGIRDFATLLDLGGSDWQASLEASEDPAGVGLFSLAPRKLTVRSRGHKVIIDEAGWTGTPVEVMSDSQRLPRCPPDIAAGAGTELAFTDDPWDAARVQSMAVFTGMDVTVDGEPCPRERFLPLPGRGTPHRALGCRIQVVPATAITPWHRGAALGEHYDQSVLLNYHGQVVAFDYHPISHHHLHFLVDLTGEPTGLRLMLPARTCLVENDALVQLKAALEREALLYLKRQGHHRLPYREYRRARELGIELPESDPVYRVGLLQTDMDPQPVKVSLPKGHALSRCYRLADTKDREDSDEANVHLLAALGQLDPPFVPVEINPEYDGYSWARLPTIRRVTVTAGKTRQKSLVHSGELICVDALAIAARCSDGKVFRSAVCLAVQPPDADSRMTWVGEDAYVTAAAPQQLIPEEIWFHLGGFSDEGDTYETQEEDVAKALEEFWLRLVGPYETLRNRLLTTAEELLPKGWKQVSLQPDGQITIRQADGSDEVLAAQSAKEVAL